MTVFQKRMECTIVLTLIFVLGYAALCQNGQNQLAEDLVRLRVIANSDSVEDQRVKLIVRDAVLNEIASWEQKPDSAQDMMEELQQHRPQLEQTVQRTLAQQHAPEQFSLVLDRDYYPTREYDSFSLPAGRYQGLKIYLGNGQGHNWWCVIYPSLCLDAASAQSSLSEEERGLIQQDNTEYTIRFRTTEVLGELGALLDN